MQQLLAFSLFLLSIRAAAQIDAPRYETAACPKLIEELAGEHAADIGCGYLFLPEDRQAATGRQLALFVVRIAARQRLPNAPLVFLSGGPGAPASARLSAILASQLPQHQEIIAIDQRGSGFSRPSLNCHEADDPKRGSTREWIRQCHERLAAEGIALGAFNSVNSAMDIHDLLVALQIEEANVYGESYGSRLALTLARDFPQRVRALILDGVLPLHVNRLEGQAPNSYEAIEQLFADCSRDQACNQAFPLLSESLFSVVRRLNREPASLHQAGLPYPIALTGADLMAQVVAMLGQRSLIAYVPAFIEAYATGAGGKDPLLEALAAQEFGKPGELDDLSEGVWLSVRCSEEAPYNRREEIVNLAAHLPGAIRRGLATMAIASLTECGWWDVPPAPANQPAASEVPTLLLSGRYDPISPPKWADETAKYLRNSWHYIFPDGGHGQLFEADAACAQSIALAFLANPQRPPAAACIDALPPPAFVKPQG